MAPAPVVEYLAPPPAATCAATAPDISAYVHSTLAPVIGYAASAPVSTDIAKLLEPPVPQVQEHVVEVDCVFPQERPSVRSIVPASAVHAAPAHAVEDVAPAPVTEYVTPALAMDINRLGEPTRLIDCC